MCNISCICTTLNYFHALHLSLPLPLNSRALQCIFVNFCDSTHSYPYPWIHIHCNAFWCIFSIQPTPTPTPEFTCIAMHFGAEMFAIKVTSTPTPECTCIAMHLGAKMFAIKVTSTPTTECTCIAMHFGAEMFAIKVTCCKLKMFAPYFTGGGKLRYVSGFKHKEGRTDLLITHAVIQYALVRVIYHPLCG